MRALILSAVFAIACAPSTDASTDASADAADTSDTTAAGPATLGAACELVARAACVRRLTCNLTFTDEDLCTERAVETCCEDGDACDDAIPEDDRSDWTTCADAVETADCETFDQAPPDACDGLEDALP